MKHNLKPDGSTQLRHVTQPRDTERFALTRRDFLTATAALGLAALPWPSVPAHAAGEAAAGSDVTENERVLSQYAERLRYHVDNVQDLRLPALSARDRRRAIPNNNRPPAVRVPKHTLPPNPAALEGAIRRVEVASGEKVCALTFDMCELATTTTGFDADIVVWLQDNDIPATFFMGGKWMRTHDRRVQQVLRDPLFELGNHAWAHGNFGLLTEARMREEILDTQCQYEAAMEKAFRNAGRTSLGEMVAQPEAMRLFRFPYGRSSETALKVLAELGLEPVQWDVVAETGGNNASLERAAVVVNKVSPGSILLFHANLVPRGSFQLLRYVATGLRRKGYRFVCVGELLAMGTPVREKEGYFEKPGDNASLDERFGAEGTGR